MALKSTRKHHKITGRTKALMLNSACFFAMVPAAFAQDQNTTETFDEIVVTGSRLIRSDLSAPSPTVVIGSADVRSSGNFTLEETLNEMPQLVPNNTASNNSQGGSGILTADLRGMGPRRTLVLVNGRRYIPTSADGLVDMTTIPDALIDRVEIITGGASAVYGSDAVSGAINFILKDDFEGLETSYQYGSTFEGDGGTHKVDVTFGSNFADDKGNIVFNTSYTNRDPVFMADREFAAVSLFDSGDTLVPGGSGNIPGTRIGLTSSQIAGINGVDLTAPSNCTAVRGVRFDSSGNPQPFCDPEDRYNFSPLNYLIRPLERWQVSSMAKFKVTDNIEAFMEGFFINAKNEFQQAPNAFTPESDGAPNGTLLLPNFAANPVLPQPFRDFLSANPDVFDADGDGTAEIIGAGRRANEIGPRNYKYDRTSWAFTAGLRGEFELGDRQWNWDTFYQFQRSSVSEYFQGLVNNLHLTLGLDVVVDPTTGEASCRNNYVGCVPVNLFGLDSITPEMAAFLSPPTGNDTSFQRQVLGGAMTGELLDLPAGPVAVAFGIEHRKEEFDFRPSSAAAAGEFGSPTPPNGGNFDLTEIFAEMRIPLLSDQPMAQDLAIELAGRYSDYSTIGAAYTWKVGMEWAPSEWVRFRGAVARAIRAPSLNELFATQTEGFTQGSDPCSAQQTPSQAQKDLCVAQGVPAGDIDTFEQIGLGFIQVSGGNPNLNEEKSDTLTLGAVITPTAIDGLNITVDYYNIKVDDAISTISAQLTVDQCFNTLDANSVFCGAISRLSNGQLDEIQATLQNVASLEVTGLDVQVDYAFDLPDALSIGNDGATLALSTVASWQFDDKQTAFAGQPAIDCAGVFAGSCSGTGTAINPGFRGVVNATYASGPASVRLQARWIGSSDIFEGRNAAVTHIDTQYYFDLSGNYEISEGLELFGGIDNLFNKQPPILGFFSAGDSNTDPALFDVIGRRFFAGVRAKF